MFVVLLFWSLGEARKREEGKKQQQRKSGAGIGIAEQGVNGRLAKKEREKEIGRRILDDVLVSGSSPLFSVGPCLTCRCEPSSPEAGSLLGLTLNDEPLSALQDGKRRADWTLLLLLPESAAAADQTRAPVVM